MKLPNADRAIVPMEKIERYSLNPEHEIGKHKAYVFKAVLGITLKDSFWLRAHIQDVVLEADAQAQSANKYGERFVVDFPLKTQAGEAVVRTTWIVRFGEDFPRLTSCHVR